MDKINPKENPENPDKPEKPIKTLALCVYIDEEHIPDSILVKCDFCESVVWISLHNVDKSPVCVSCLERLIAEANASGDTIEPILSPQDILEAFKYLVEKRKKK